MKEKTKISIELDGIEAKIYNDLIFAWRNLPLGDRIDLLNKYIFQKGMSALFESDLKENPLSQDQLKILRKFFVKE